MDNCTISVSGIQEKIGFFVKKKILKGNLYFYSIYMHTDIHYIGIGLYSNIIF